MPVPTVRYVEGVLVVVETCSGDPAHAFAVAADYLQRLERLQVERGFLRALWFVGTPFDPGLLLRPGQFVPARALARYTVWLPEMQEITPWYFAREF